LYVYLTVPTIPYNIRHTAEKQEIIHSTLSLKRNTTRIRTHMKLVENIVFAYARISSELFLSMLLCSY
jgi:hypothetical protein